MQLVKFFIALYVILLICHYIGLIGTSYKRARGWWALVPFRVSSWCGYKINWVWVMPKELKGY